MRKVKREDAKTPRILLTILALGIVVAVVSSTSQAAPSPSASKPAVKSPTILDPFTLRTMVAPGASAQAPLGNAFGHIKNPNPRRDIRIPHRPNKRSGFRPHDDC